MASPFTGRPAVSGDDGDWIAGTSILIISDRVRFGRTGASARNSWYRVPLVDISQGANIIFAKIVFKAYSNQSGTVVRVNIYMEDSDDAVAPTTKSEADNLTLTTAFVAWDGEGAWTQDTTYDSLDITVPVQEIISRPGWVSNNALMVVIKDDGSDSGAFREADAQDLGETTAALLTIEHSTFIPKVMMI